MSESDIKDGLARCLDGLQEAAEALDDIECEDDLQLGNWYDEIQSLYEKILERYEK